MWSFACMIFEMATGDFLFEPRKGKTYGKDDDHIAQMMELLGRMPDYMALGGIKSRRFFDRTGHLRRIRGLNLWPLKKVLMEKYRYEQSEALAFTDFLLPMLRWDPDKRASAEEMLNHPWLRMDANYETRLTKEQFNAVMEKQKLEKDLNQELDDPYKNEEMTKLTDSECEIFPGDQEDNDDFLRDLSDDESPYFSGPEDK